MLSKRCRPRHSAQERSCRRVAPSRAGLSRRSDPDPRRSGRQYSTRARTTAVASQMPGSPSRNGRRASRTTSSIAVCSPATDSARLARSCGSSTCSPPPGAGAVTGVGAVVREAADVVSFGGEKLLDRSPGRSVPSPTRRFPAGPPTERGRPGHLRVVGGLWQPRPAVAC